MEPGPNPTPHPERPRTRGRIRARAGWGQLTETDRNDSIALSIAQWYPHTLTGAI